MKALALCAVLLCAAAVSAVEWVEPSFVEEKSTSKLRGGATTAGVSHTVSGRKGMVTYISPARHVQTSGIVLTPPPSVSVVSAQLPVPQPQVLVQPIVVEAGLPSAFDPRYVPSHLAHDLAYAHDAVAVDAHPHLHGHHHHLPPLDFADHNDLHHSDHHRLYHGLHTSRVVAAGATPAPLGVPASLYGLPYHQPHYDHASPISHGAIVVPHDSLGRLPLEEAAFAGYNPAPVLPLPHAVTRTVVRQTAPLPNTVTYTVPRIVRAYGGKHDD